MDRRKWREKIEVAWSELSADEETMILDAIEKHWVLLNKQIDDVFAGKKIKILTLKKQKGQYYV